MGSINHREINEQNYSDRYYYAVRKGVLAALGYTELLSKAESSKSRATILTEGLEVDSMISLSHLCGYDTFPIAADTKLGHIKPAGCSINCGCLDPTTQSNVSEKKRHPCGGRCHFLPLMKLTSRSAPPAIYFWKYSYPFTPLPCGVHRPTTLHRWSEKSWLFEYVSPPAFPLLQLWGDISHLLRSYGEKKY